MWTFKWLPDPVHSRWEFDLYTGAALGSPAWQSPKFCYFIPATLYVFSEEKKKM